MMFATALPVLLLTVGFTIDYGIVIKQRQVLQTAADAAALAGAKGLSLADAKRENVEAVVKAIVDSYASRNAAAGSVKDYTVLADVRDDPLEVHVSISQIPRTVFGASFGLSLTAIEVIATARVVGQPNICILGLDESASGTIDLQKQARVTGQNCAVYSNSTHKNSIKSKNDSVLSATIICAAGGRDGDKGNFDPEPYTDCPTFDDPLAGRMAPPVGVCDPSLENDISTSRTLFPGTYCGGLRIGDDAEVKLQPGIYIIKDGPLLIQGSAKIDGTVGVGFYLTGTNATFTFEPETTIDLSAPTKGVMAGLLIFEDRKQSTTGIHKILSENARLLLGTIYLPRGQIHVDANQPVADKSAYTSIVARMVTLYGGPHLVLNTNYHLTSVPVPKGIKGAGQPVRLSR
jgi:hypothetical protein